MSSLEKESDIPCDPQATSLAVRSRIAALLLAGIAGLAPAYSAGAGTFDRLEGLADFQQSCEATHIGFFGDVTTVSLGDRIAYRTGRGPWLRVGTALKGVHSIARLPNGKWLINDSATHQMIELQNLDGHGEIIRRSELGGYALFRPHDAIVDPQSGYVYVVDGNRRLFRFRDLSGPIDVWTFGPNQWGYIRGVSWFDGRLHLADATRGEVHRIDDFDRRLVTTFKSPSVPLPKSPPIPDRENGGGSLSSTGLVLNDVEKAGGWYYGTNLFSPALAQGGDPYPARLIRWRSWKDFERGAWQDMTNLLPAKYPVIPYFITLHDGSIFISLIDSAIPKRSGPPPYDCVLKVPIQDGRASGRNPTPRFKPAVER